MIRRQKKILGKTVVSYEERVSIDKLMFFMDNPRIFSAVRKNTNNLSPNQEEIFQILKNESNVRDLIQRIEHQGSVLEPLLVKRGTYEVLEGNSRLAACKILIEKYEKKTKADILMEITHLPCELIPEDTEDDIIFAWLGELHLKGKLDWDAYEKASYIHRRMTNLIKKNNTYDESKRKVAAQAGESKQEIETRYDIIELMSRHNVEDILKYSYYDVVMRSRHVQGKIASNSNEKIIAKCIKEYPGKATDFRTEIIAVCKNKKASRLFFEKEYDLKEAFDEIDLDIDKIIQRIIKFRNKTLTQADEKINKINKFDPNFNKVRYQYSHLLKDVKKRCDKLDKKKEA